MPLYNCFYVNTDNKVVGTRSVKSPSSEAAMERARQLVGSDSSVAGIEIRKGGRLDWKVWLRGELTNGASLDAPPIVATSMASGDGG